MSPSLFLFFHSMALQTYEKMSKAKKAEATHNNAGTSARESGADAVRYV